MDEDRPVSLAVLRSVIDSYRKKKESLEKRELQVKDRLSALRRGRSRAPKEVESFEINIETRESIVRSTSEVAPTVSYDTPNGFYSTPTGSFVSPQGYRSEADGLMFPSQFAQYRHSEQSVDRSDELIPEKVSRQSKSYKSYNTRCGEEFNSYAEGNKGTGESKRRRTRKKSTEEEPRVSRRYDELMVQKQKQVVNASESDKSLSQMDIRREQNFTVRRSRSPSSAANKDRVDRKAEYMAEKLVRISPKMPSNPTTNMVMKRSASQGREKKGSSHAPYKNEVDDSAQIVKQHKTLRRLNNEVAEPKMYPEYQEIRSDYNVSHSHMDQGFDSKSRKSTSSNKSYQPRRALDSHSRSIKKQIVIDTESSQSLVGAETRSRDIKKAARAIEYSDQSRYTRTQSPPRKIDETRSLVTRTRTARSPSRVEETRSLVTRPATPLGPERTSRPRSQPTPEQSLVKRSVVRGFDEAYSNNFLIFLIRKSLPRAMTSLLLPSNGFQDKTAHEVLNYVDEIETIKKLICDELDRREAIGKPFKILRKEKELMMKNFLFARVVSDRVKRGVPVQQAVTNLHDNDTASALQLEVRTVRALRQARDLLGGDLPDPGKAGSLQEAAQDYLQRLGRLQRGRSESQQVELLGDSLVHIEKRLPPPSILSHHQARRSRPHRQR